MRILCWVLGMGAVRYFQQERLLFFPVRLAPDYRFRFAQRFEERWLPTADGTRLHGLLFPVDSARGLVFYLHGNGRLDTVRYKSGFWALAVRAGSNSNSSSSNPRKQDESSVDTRAEENIDG